MLLSKEQILERLKKIRDTGDCDPVYTLQGNKVICTGNRFGLCANIFYLVEEGEVTECLQLAMKKWPEHSGDSSYPVPCPHGGDPGLIYEGYTEEMQNMYDHGDKYGQSRQRLVKHLIKALEEL